MSKKSITAIEWTGGQRTVPKVGLVCPGHILKVPSDLDAVLAADFIRQGLAKKHKPANDPKRAEQQKE